LLRQGLNCDMTIQQQYVGANKDKHAHTHTYTTRSDTTYCQGT
jgi:hypothetical protein